jgi:uncharacterized protein YdaU (DUF1376 family)
VNYYEHHIRDYDAATAHLTWDEDMAYTRLMRWYYRKEQPIPAELSEACRQVRATSGAQRKAVESVLKEFFELREDGWHQATCDETIATFQAGEPEREAKKKNEDTRLSRHRAERAELFAIINGAGQHMAWNAPIAEVRAAAARIAAPAETLPATNEPESATPATAPATAPATPATATQTPDTTPHSPDTTPQELKHTPGPAVTDAGRVCGLLRQAGIADTNPGHPDLLVLLEAGATDAEFKGAAATTVDRGKGFAYLLGTLKRQRQEAARTAGQLHTGPLPVRMTPAEARAVAASPRLAAAHLRPAPTTDQETVDVTARIVG